MGLKTQNLAWKSCGQTSLHLFITWKKKALHQLSLCPTFALMMLLIAWLPWALTALKDPAKRLDHPQGRPTLTSFSPQMLLMIELEAGLDDGPRTATTPLGRI